MPLSTEVFVMAIFIAGCPFFFFILKDADLPGRHFFIGSYFLLTLSNIATVVEEFWLNTLFNTIEHLFIVLSSILLLVAILKLTDKNKPRRTSPIFNQSKD